LRVVRDGLKAGEKIVVNGLQRVHPGAPITPEIVAMDADPDAKPADKTAAKPEAKAAAATTKADNKQVAKAGSDASGKASTAKE
jgi:multidrug efflux system membrane fusion protein